MPRTAWHADTPRLHEDITAATRGGLRRIASRLSHDVEPPLEIPIGLRDDVKGHVRMLHATELRALTPEET